MVTAFTRGRLASVDWSDALLVLYSEKEQLLVVLMGGVGGS